ncbi:MAG: hypothetical protein R3324_11870 [Halobacteriales archaeon]|nr:hypothetical protein [Halobacteriales archaeon]
MGSEAVEDDALAEVPADAAVLIAGPPMTGKYWLLVRLIQLHADRVVFITTKNGYERVREDFREAAGAYDEAHLGVVDCLSYHQSIDVDAVDGPVRFTDSPENLTRIGVKFTELFDQFMEDPEAGRIGVGIHSVSQLLMHSEVKTVYQFLQVLVGQVRNTGNLFVAVLDSGSTEDETLTSLQTHFDGLITTRENDDGAREFRIRGLTPSASPWTEF